ncbi:MerR family transcriptional regulator [Rubrivivax albus]|uniref:MerR family transcriptional regulator n=1 Tax=Rubrivivax albus TaxID=2499835 RepID=A0A3S2U9T7_9BURK|nr:MerR family transcriptional regulator [Rubrivivax albus]RVT52477.1 MerR family transcriptional regulator [Rubrivivax albus]
MTDPTSRSVLTLSIAAVERDTGLSKDTLRVWERRYGFPNPERDGSGERAYPLEQVERLRLVKRLLDVGHRPGRVVALEVDDLQRLVDASGAEVLPATPLAPGSAESVDECLALIRQHDLIGLRRQLGRDMARLGLPAFVLERAVPLTRAIGDAWLRGQMQVFEEHACTEVLQSVLRGALAALPPAEPLATPRVLLATLPGEPHALALLLAEALLATEGAVCVPLGPQTPVWDLVLAADAYRVDIVLLACSGTTGTTPMVDALAELRDKLPVGVALWVGGNAPALHRRPVDGVLPFQALQDLLPALADWRARQP